MFLRIYEKKTGSSKYQHINVKFIYAGSIYTDGRLKYIPLEKKELLQSAYDMYERMHIGMYKCEFESNGKTFLIHVVGVREIRAALTYAIKALARHEMQQNRCTPEMKRIQAKINTLNYLLSRCIKFKK